MMAGGGRRCVTRSEWGVLGEELEWPQGLHGQKRFPSSGVHGETWLVTNTAVQLQQELAETQAKLEEGITRLDKGIQEAAALVEEDPLVAEDAYEDEYDMADRINPHDRSDPTVLLEERQALKTDLEDQLVEVSGQLQDLNNSSIRFTWNRKDLPEQLHRLDKPWEDADRQQLLEARRAAEAAELAARKAAEKKAKKKGKPLPPPPPPQEPETPDTFVVKLYEPAARHVGDGRFMPFSDASKEKAEELLSEGKLQMKILWRYIAEKGSFDFEKVNLLPIVHVASIERKHKTFGSVFNAGYFRPYMKNGTVGEVVKKFAGRKGQLFFRDTLLVANAKGIISWCDLNSEQICWVLNCCSMAFLEHHRLFHGSIQPNNIFISDDGFCLLIGDFLPRSEFTRWVIDMSKDLTSVPVFFSPEYKQGVSYKRIQKPHFYTEKLSPFKHDVFCFGLFLLYLATMEEPRGLNDNSKRCAAAIEALRQKDRNPELISLLNSTLTFDPATRPSWKGLLGSGDRIQLETSDFLRGMGHLLGITRPDAEDAFTGDNPSVQMNAGSQTGAQDEGRSGCSMM